MIARMKFPKPKKSATKNLKARCIELSKEIVTRPGRCRKCHLARPLHPHHVIYRSYAHTVALVKNQVPFCPECHFWAHSYPDEMLEWFEKQFPGLLSELREIAGRSGKPDWDEVFEKLKREEKDLGVR